MPTFKQVCVAGVAVCLLLSAAWMTWILWVLTLPQYSFDAIFRGECYFVLCLLFLFGAAAIWLAKPQGFRWSLRQLLAAMLLLGVTLGCESLIRERQPLRLGFRASQSALDKLADEIAQAQPDADNPQIIDRRVGRYHVSRGYVDGDAVLLHLKGGAEGHYALVRVSRQHEHVIIRRQCYGMFRTMRLSDRWVVRYDAYIAMKVGWS